MKDFIERILGTDINTEPADFSRKLPLLYLSLYDFQIVHMQNIKWVTAIPKEKINLSTLRKHHRQMEKMLDLHCVLYFRTTSMYTRNTMITERIPFIIDGRDLYLPFLGILLNADQGREIKPVQKISFLTQKMILTAIYENWSEVNVTSTSERLGITKMSASRCFDEIEFFDMPILSLKGKSRIIVIPEDKRHLWNQIKDNLRNPVIATFFMKDDLKLDVRSGMSALADYSLIEDNAYPTYAVGKRDIKLLGIKDKRVALKNEIPGCIVQETGYIISFSNKNSIDPLSLSLSLNEKEKADERTEKCVREMLEEYVWTH